MSESKDDVNPKLQSDNDSSSVSSDEREDGVPVEGLMASGRVKQSKGEKKARKMFSKLRVKPVNGIVRVIVKKSKNIIFVIENPEVVKLQTSDTYIVFGDIRVEDLSHRAQMAAAQKFKAPDMANQAAAATAITEQEEEEESDGEPVDDTALDRRDIELVMSQANVGRKRAIRALNENGNDIVNAIMAITM